MPEQVDGPPAPGGAEQRAKEHLKSQEQKYRAVFAEFDTKKSGFIAEREFVVALRILGLDSSDRVVAETVRNCTRSNGIDHETFISFLPSLESRSSLTGASGRDASSRADEARDSPRTRHSVSPPRLAEPSPVSHEKAEAKRVVPPFSQTYTGQSVFNYGSPGASTISRVGLGAAADLSLTQEASLRSLGGLSAYSGGMPARPLAYGASVIGSGLANGSASGVFEQGSGMGLGSLGAKPPSRGVVGRAVQIYQERLVQVESEKVRLDNVVGDIKRKLLHEQSQREQCESRCDAIANEKSGLEKKVEDLENALRREKSARTRAEEHVDSLSQDHVEKLKKRISQLEDDAEKRERLIGELSDREADKLGDSLMQMGRQDEESRGLEDKVKQLTFQVYRLEADKEATGRYVEQLESRLKDDQGNAKALSDMYMVRSQSEALVDEIAQLRARLADSQEQAAKAVRRYEQLLEDKDEELAELQAMNDKLSGNVQSRNIKISEMEDRVDQLVSDLRVARGDLLRLEAEKEQQAHRADMNESSVHERSSRVSQLQDDLRMAESQHAVSEEERKRLVARTAKAEEVAAVSNQTIQDLEQEVGELKHKCSSLQRRHEEHEMSLSEAEHREKFLSRSCSDFEQRVIAVEAEWSKKEMDWDSDMRRLKEEHRREVSDLQREVKSMDEQLEDLRANREGMLRELESRIRDMEVENDALTVLLGDGTDRPTKSPQKLAGSGERPSFGTLMNTHHHALAEIHHTRQLLEDKFHELKSSLAIVEKTSQRSTLFCWRLMAMSALDRDRHERKTLSLQEKLEDLEDADVQSKAKQVEVATVEAAEAQAAVKKLRENLERVRLERDALESTLIIRTKEYEDYMAKSQAQRDEDNRRSMNHEELIRERDRVIDSLRSDVQRMSESLDEASRRLADHIRTADSLQEELRTKLKASEVENQVAQVRLESCEREAQAKLFAVTEDVRRLNEEVSRLSAANASLESRADREHHEGDSLLQKVYQMTEVIHEKNSKIEKLEMDCSVLRESSTKAMVEIRNLKEAKERLQDDKDDILSQLRQEKAALSQRLAASTEDSETSIMSLRRQLESLTKEVDVARNEKERVIDDAELEKEELQSRLQVQLESLQASLEESEALQWTRTNALINEERAKASDAAFQLEKALAESASMKSLHQKMESQLRSRIDSLQSQLNENMATYQKQIADLTSRHEKDRSIMVEKVERSTVAQKEVSDQLAEVRRQAASERAEFEQRLFSSTHDKEMAIREVKQHAAADEAARKAREDEMERNMSMAVSERDSALQRAEQLSVHLDKMQESYRRQLDDVNARAKELTEELHSERSLRSENSNETIRLQEELRLMRERAMTLEVAEELKTDLKQREDDMRMRLQKVTEECVDAQAKARIAEDRLEDVKKSRDEYEKEVRKAQAMVTALEEKVVLEANTWERRLQGEHSERSALKDQLNSTREKLDAANVQREAAEKGHERAKAEADGLKARVIEEQEKIKILEHSLDAERQSRSHAEAEVTAAEGRVAEAGTRAAAAVEAEKSRADKEIQRLQAALTNATERLVEMEEKFSKSERQAGAVKELSRSRAEAEDRAANLGSELDQEKERMRLLQRSHADLQQRTRNLAESEAELTNRLSQAESLAEDAERKKGTIEEEVARLRAELAEARSGGPGLASAEARAEEMENVARNLRVELGEMQAKLNQEKDRVIEQMKLVHEEAEANRELKLILSEKERDLISAQHESKANAQLVTDNRDLARRVNELEHHARDLEDRHAKDVARLKADAQKAELDMINNFHASKAELEAVYEESEKAVRSSADIRIVQLRDDLTACREKVLSAERQAESVRQELEEENRRLGNDASEARDELEKLKRLMAVGEADLREEKESILRDIESDKDSLRGQIDAMTEKARRQENLHRDEVEQHQKETERLNATIERLQRELQGATTDLDQAHKRYDLRLKESERDRSELEHRCQQLNSELSSRELALENARAELEDTRKGAREPGLKEQLEAEKNERRVLEETKENLMQLVDEIQEGKRSLEARNSELENERKSLSEKVREMKGLEGQTDSLRRKSMNLVNENEMLDTELSRAIERREAIERSLRESVASLEEEKQHLMSEMDERWQEIVSLKSEMVTLKSQLAEAKSNEVAVEERESSLARANGELERLRGEQAAAQDAHDEELRNARRECANIQKELEDARRQATSMQAEVDDSRESVAKLKAMYHEIRGDLDAEQTAHAASIESLRLAEQENTRMLELHAVELERVRGAITKERADNARDREAVGLVDEVAERRIGEAETRARAAADELSKANERIVSLENDIELAREKNDALRRQVSVLGVREDEIVDLREQVDQWKMQCNKWKETVTAVNAQCDQWREEVNSAKKMYALERTKDDLNTQQLLSEALDECENLKLDVVRETQQADALRRAVDNQRVMYTQRLASLNVRNRRRALGATLFSTWALATWQGRCRILKARIEEGVGEENAEAFEARLRARRDAEEKTSQLENSLREAYNAKALMEERVHVLEDMVGRLRESMEMMQQYAAHEEPNAELAERCELLSKELAVYKERTMRKFVHRMRESSVEKMLKRWKLYVHRKRANQLQSLGGEKDVLAKIVGDFEDQLAESEMEKEAAFEMYSEERDAMVQRIDELQAHIAALEDQIVAGHQEMVIGEINSLKDKLNRPM